MYLCLIVLVTLVLLALYLLFLVIFRHTATRQRKHDQSRQPKHFQWAYIDREGSGQGKGATTTAEKTTRCKR